MNAGRGTLPCSFTGVARRGADRAGYWSWLLVALVVVAVAHRRLEPSSSATTSTTDRAAAVLGGPTPLLESTHDHDPVTFRQGLGRMLGLVPPHDHDIERVRRTPHLAYSFLRRTSLSVS